MCTQKHEEKSSTCGGARSGDVDCRTCGGARSGDVDERARKTTCKGSRRCSGTIVHKTNGDVLQRGVDAFDVARNDLRVTRQLVDCFSGCGGSFRQGCDNVIELCRLGDEVTLLLDELLGRSVTFSVVRCAACSSAAVKFPEIVQAEVGGVQGEVSSSFHLE